MPLLSPTRILVLFIILNMNFLSLLICVSNCVNKTNIKIVRNTNKIEVKVQKMEEKPYKKCTETRIKLEIEKQIEYTKRNPY